MKKIIVFLLIFVSYNISAFENFVFKASFPNFGYDMNSTETGAFEINPLILGIEYKPVRIGLEYSVAKLWFFMDHNKTYKASLLNFNLYYNMYEQNLKENRDYFFYFGFFNKANFLFMGKKARNDDFVCTAGLRAGLCYNVEEFIYWHVIGTEIGYRNINNRSTFYLGFNIDIIGSVNLLSTKRY